MRHARLDIVRPDIDVMSSAHYPPTMDALDIALAEARRFLRLA